MNGTRYIVELDIRQVGKLDIGKQASGAEKLEHSSKKIANHFSATHKFAENFSHSVDWAAEKITHIATHTAMIGGAAVFGGLTVGVAHLNAELEKTTVSLATVFSANGVARDMPAGLEMSKKTIQQMRMDAQALPGEFEDLLGIFRMSAIPGFHAGLGVQQLRQLSSQAMVAGAVSGLPMDQVAREFAQLMQGRAGAHNVFGAELLGLSGENATKYNQMDPAKRVAILQTEMAKYGKAIGTFSTTWEAASSTLIDTGKQVGQAATQDLFEKVKGTINQVNEWYSENRVEVGRWANLMGLHFAHAFDWGKAKLLEWWPLIREFGSNAWKEMKEVWTEISPIVHSASEALKSALKNPNTPHLVTQLVELTFALKAFTSAAHVLSSKGLVGSGIRMLPELAKGAPGAVRGIASAGGWLAERAMAGTSIGGMAIGGTGTGALAGGVDVAGAATAGLATAAVTAGAALAALAGVGAAVYEGYQLHQELQEQADADEKARADFIGRSWEEMLGRNDTYSKDIYVATEEYAKSINEVRQRGLEAAERDQNAAEAENANMLASQMELELQTRQLAATMEKYSDDMASKMIDKYESQDAFLVNRLLHGPGGPLSDEKAAKAPKTHGGAGGTNIQKVEIVVTGNDNPSRVAHIVMEKLSQMSRNKTSSTDVPNYSAGRR